jgi:hypothetical protein
MWLTISLSAKNCQARQNRAATGYLSELFSLDGRVAVVTGGEPRAARACVFADGGFSAT